MTTSLAEKPGGSRKSAGPPPPTPFVVLMLSLSGSVPYIMLMIAVAFACMSWWNARSAERLDRYGVVTEGQMWSEYLGRATRTDEGRTRTVHRMRTTVEFQDETGETHSRTRSHDVSAQPRTYVSSRRPVTIRYDRENPSFFEEGRVGKKADVARNTMHFVIICLAGAACFFAWGGWKALRAIRVRERGRRIRVKARRAPEKTKDRDYYKVHWKTDDGLHGVSIRNPRKEEEINPGASICVYTDGKSTWWEGDVGSPKRR